MSVLVISTNYNQQTLNNNLLRSEIIKYHDSVLAPDFANVSKSYNWATSVHSPRVKELMDQKYSALIFVHEDVFLPDYFHYRLMKAISQLDSNWGVLGIAGVNYKNGGKTTHGHLLDRGRNWGKAIDKPEPVQTLDELILIVNPKAELEFDEQFDLDFYGGDLCMQAHEKGLGVYVIPGYLEHNSSRPFGGRTPSFYENQNRFVKKWRHKLPIATTCALLK